MITREEIKHFESIGYKDIYLDQNKNPRTRKDFVYPKYLLSLEEKKMYIIDKRIIKK